MIRFSEWVSALTPTEFTELALILFTAVFVAVIGREMTRGRRREHARWAALPLDDDRGAP